MRVIGNKYCLKFLNLYFRDVLDLKVANAIHQWRFAKLQCVDLSLFGKALEDHAEYHP